jgi:hypothetical protein
MFNRRGDLSVCLHGTDMKLYPAFTNLVAAAERECGPRLL